AGGQPWPLVVADFNGDGKPDLAELSPHPLTSSGPSWMTQDVYIRVAPRLISAPATHTSCADRTALRTRRAATTELAYEL
ncbi:MAG: FG-GAP repeat domain-containing protein, partial [Solirubrobacteraceae bacterium]